MSASDNSITERVRALVQPIVDVLAGENASILVGYDPAGGYGHPDHLHVHRAVRTAAALARRRPRLYEATLPREPAWCSRS